MTNKPISEEALEGLHIRLHSKIFVNEIGCWIWTGASRGKHSRSHNRYGTISLQGRCITTHNASLLLDGRVRPPSMVTDHLCRVTLCCNPRHLEIVSNRENTIRGIGPQSAAKRQRAKTHCPHGHEYTPENTCMGRRGRSCRTCKNLSRLKSQRVLREALRTELTKRGGRIVFDGDEG